MKTETVWQAAQTEAQFQSAVQDFATMRGWSWMHIQKINDARNYWRTPVKGPLGAGWPDLILVRKERMIFAELKAQSGKVTGLQREILNLLQSTPAEVYVWKPSDWPNIEEVLA